jgi:hypothetical protein
MDSSPVGKAALTGVVLQALMVLVGKFVPAIGTIPNFYAIAGSVLAVVTGSLAAKWSPASTPTSANMTAGAAAGGSSSVLGGLLAVMTGQWPGFQVVQLLLPLLSGGVAGGLGGAVGRMFAK